MSILSKLVQDAEDRFGGKVQVDMKPIIEIVAAKVKADAATLVAHLSDSTKLGYYESQQKLLNEIQAGHRALMIMHGIVDTGGRTIGQSPTTEVSSLASSSAAVNASDIGSHVVNMTLNADPPPNEDEDHKAAGDGHPPLYSK